MGKLIPLLVVGFGAVLAIIVGQRMSTDAMAVVIGVAVGVAASVPTSLLLVALLRRERRGYRDETSAPPAYPQIAPPNVLVFNPADWLAQQQAQLRSTPLPPPEHVFDGGMRRLRVVGNEDEWGAGEW